MTKYRKALEQYLLSRFEAESKQAAELASALKEEKIQRGTILLNPGQKVNSGFFVAEGCLRSYVIDSKGREHIIQFAPEEWLISDLLAMLSDTLSSFYIDAVEDSVVFRFGTEIFNLAVDKDSPSMILPIVRSHHATQRRLISVLSSSAEERYQDFIRTYPMLAHRLPLNMIASYIGITPQSLSRIRNRYAAKS